MVNFGQTVYLERIRVVPLFIAFRRWRASDEAFLCKWLWTYTLERLILWKVGSLYVGKEEGAISLTGF